MPVTMPAALIAFPQTQTARRLAAEQTHRREVGSIVRVRRGPQVRSVPLAAGVSVFGARHDGWGGTGLKGSHRDQRSRRSPAAECDWSRQTMVHHVAGRC